MSHIENIHALFSKSFVENPLLETFETGNLSIESGLLVASDPLITPDKQPFLQEFPKGNFPVYIHKERESNCIAYTEVVFGKDEVAHWQMALCEGQNLEELNAEEVFGFPVESGMACVMDAEAQNLLNQLEQELFHQKGADFMGIYEEFFHEHFFDENGAIDQFAFLKPYSDKSLNIFSFEAGLGEGFYASYIGYDAQNNPVKFVTEFIEIKSE